MKPLLPILLAPLSLLAQQRPDPAEQLQRKLASPFLANAEWTLDFDKAREQAVEREQLVFGYFTTAGP